MKGAAYTAAKNVKPTLVTRAISFARGCALAAIRRIPKIITGIIVTGDSFIASTEKCAELRKKLKADAVEMEGAAVAQICYQRQIDHLVIRSISDSADEGAVTDKQMFYILAAKNSSDLVAEMIGLLSSEFPTEKGTANNQSGS